MLIETESCRCVVNPGSKRWLVTKTFFAISAVAYSWIAAMAQPAHSVSNPINEIQTALRAGNPATAHSLATAQLRRSPRDPRLWTLDGIALNGLHKDSEALNAFNRALKASPNYLAALEGTAQILYSRGDLAGIPVLQKLVKLSPENPTSHAMLGALEFRRGSFEEAASEFATGASVVEQSPDALLQYGTCLGELRRFAESAKVFSEALAIKPGDRVLRWNLALAQWHAGDRDAALASLEPLLDQAETSGEIHSLAAEIYEEQDKVPEAVAELRAAMKASPKDPENYLDFAALSYRYRSYEAGIDILNTGLLQLSRSAPLYAARGVLYAQMARFDEAFTDFERANTLDPGTAFGTLAKGVAHSQQSNAKGAIASFALQVKQHPDDALAHYLLAEALFEGESGDGGGAIDEAIVEAVTASRLDSKMLEPHDLLATMYLRRQRISDAVAECQRALAIQPKDEQALYHLLLAQRRSGNKQEVAELVKRLSAVHQAAQEQNSGHRNYKLTTQPN